TRRGWDPGGPWLRGANLANGSFAQGYPVFRPRLAARSVQRGTMDLTAGRRVHTDKHRHDPCLSVVQKSKVRSPQGVQILPMASLRDLVSCARRAQETRCP